MFGLICWSYLSCWLWLTLRPDLKHPGCKLYLFKNLAEIQFFFCHFNDRNFVIWLKSDCLLKGLLLSGQVCYILSLILRVLVFFYFYEVSDLKDVLVCFSCCFPALWLDYMSWISVSVIVLDMSWAEASWVLFLFLCSCHQSFIYLFCFG